MKKHAYLIIANKSFNQLQILINTLDDVRNDLYVLIDKKASKAVPKFDVHNANLTMLPRMSIFWGSYSQVEAEIALLQWSIDKKYDYYHFLSGQDLPLANQNDIHNFFDNNPNKVFLTYSSVCSKKQISDRTKKYKFDRHFRNDDQIIQRIFWSVFRRLEKILLLFQKSRVPVETVSYASNWVSIDHEFAEILIDYKKWIYDHFHGGFLVDEVFIPTLINYLSLNDKVYYGFPVSDNPDEFQGNLRYINWWQGNPYTWKNDSIGDLIKAKKMGHFFSRKFDENVDSEIIKLVVSSLN